MFTSCRSNHDDKKVVEYTCPMHPEIIRDEPGKCPICGMDLVLKEMNNELVPDSGMNVITRPVNKSVLSDVPVIKAESGAKVITTALNGVINYDARNRSVLTSRVSGRIEKLNIKFNYQPIKKGELVMEIYSPELSAAQRELLLIAENGDYRMFLQAKKRLLLLGMRESDIKSILYEKEILYRFPIYSSADGYVVQSQNNSGSVISPAQNSIGGGMDEMRNNQTSTFASEPAKQTPTLWRQGQYVSAGQELFTIYKAGSIIAEIALPTDVAPFITKNQKVLIQGAGDSGLQAAKIDLIEPVLRNNTSYVLAKCYLKKKYAVGELVKVNVPIVYKGGWWIPSDAVVSLGPKSIVFKKDHNVFEPMEVNVGAKVGNMTQVSTDIGDLELAANAHYLVDSESFIE